jgi:hypothetical protein
MSDALLVRKIIERVVKSLRKPNTGDGQFLPDNKSWKIKSSNMHGSDADNWIGFRSDIPENEYDPRTGKLIKNDEIGDDTTYLQQWDADNTGYVEEEEDVRRDNGVGLARIVMQQITPIKS